MKGWTRRNLSELSSINYGYTEKASPDRIGPNFLRITDLQDGSVNWETVPYCRISDSDKKKFTLKSNDIVFARTGATTGKSFLVLNPPDAVFASYLIRLRIQESGLLPTYLSYFFQTPEYWQAVESGTAGSAQGGFNATKLGELSIPLPPLPEQRRIVAILDEAFAGLDAMRANAEKNLQNARDLFDSYLNRVFSERGEGWVETTLGTIAKIKGGKRVPKGYKLLSEKTPYVYLRVTDFSETGSISQSDLRYVGAEVYQGISRYIINSDNLYVSIAGTIGKTGMVPRELDGSLLTENACRLIFSTNVNPKFVFYFTKSIQFRLQVSAATRTAAQPKLALERLSEITLDIPNLQRQAEIVSACDALIGQSDLLRAIYEAKLISLAELKQSILQKAFAGELASSESIAA